MLARRRCCCGGSLPCFPCAMPLRDLEITVANSTFGSETIPFHYVSAGTRWENVCHRGLVYGLTCSAGVHNFGVTYFLSGECPTGSSQTCSTQDAPPLNVHLDSYVCDPFELRYSVSSSGCGFLAGNGYSTFRVHLPGAVAASAGGLSRLDRLRGLVRSLRSFGRDRFRLASSAEAARRLSICGACDRFEASSGRCLECGCYMTVKARVAAMRCPIEKW